MPKSANKRLLYINRGLVFFLVVIFFLGCLPILGKQTFIQFLPDADWTRNANGVARFVAILSSFCAAAFILIGRKLRKNGLLPRTETKGKIQLTLFGQILCATLLMLPMGHMSVTIGIPFVVTALAGEPGQATYFIKRSRKPDKRRCHRPVAFEGLPFLGNEICDVPDAFRKSVFPGTKVQITGRATSLGIFPKTLAKLD